LHAEFKFTHVVALSEEDLIRAGRPSCHNHVFVQPVPVFVVARLRGALGISYGQNLESALRFRDKVTSLPGSLECLLLVPVGSEAGCWLLMYAQVLMKRVLSARGLGVPEYAAVECASDIVNFISVHGYPVGLTIFHFCGA
jgi:hypothetical protein